MNQGNPKHIVLVSTFFGTTGTGGGLTHTLTMLREWLRRGNRVTILRATPAREDLGEFLPSIQKGQLVLHDLVDEPSALRFTHRFDARIEERASALLRECRPDVIHVHNIQGMLSAVRAAVRSGFPVAYTPLDFGLYCQTWYLYDGTATPCSGPEPSKCYRCIVRTRGLSWSRLAARAFELAKAVALGLPGIHNRLDYFSAAYRSYLKASTREVQQRLDLWRGFRWILAPSPPVTEVARKLRGGLEGISEIPYPVKAPERPAAEPPSGPLRLLFLGHGQDIKGWPFFEQVLEALPDGLALEIHDHGQNSGRYRLANERVKRYWRPSAVPRSTGVYESIFSNDATLVPSLWHENTPFVVLESLAVGRPVVASDQAGIRNRIRHGTNGFLIPAGNRDAWCAELTRLARNPELVRSARAQCRYELSPGSYVDRLEALGC